LIQRDLKVDLPIDFLVLNSLLPLALQRLSVLTLQQPVLLLGRQVGAG
jgi:hypothetical protein